MGEERVSYQTEEHCLLKLECAPPGIPSIPTLVSLLAQRTSFSQVANGLTVRLKELQQLRNSTAGWRTVKGLSKPGVDSQLPLLYQALAGARPLPISPYISRCMRVTLRMSVEQPDDDAFEGAELSGRTQALAELCWSPRRRETELASWANEWKLTSCQRLQDEKGAHISVSLVTRGIQ